MSAADLIHYWVGTEEESFLMLANACITALRGSKPPGIVLTPVPLALERAGQCYRDCPALQAVFSCTLSLTEKLQKLRDIARDAQSASAGIRARTTGSQAKARKKKLAKGKASRASGRYGYAASGVAKRSPHIPLGRHSPPPIAAEAAVVTEFVRSSLRKIVPPSP